MANQCCNTLKQVLSEVSAKAKGAVIPLPPRYSVKYPLPQYAQFLIDFSALPPAFIVQPMTQDPVPTLAEMLQQVRQPFAQGFTVWRWHNVDQPGKINLILPDAPSTKTRVHINGAEQISPRDYSIASTTLTFTSPLDVGDTVTVLGYGG